MKASVLVLVPVTVASAAVQEFADGLLAPYRMIDGVQTTGKFDYLVGTVGAFDDPVAEGQLPAQLKRSLRGRICAVERLPAGFTPNALVTPDGVWHDRDAASQAPALDWESRYQQLLAAHLYCWAIQYAAHS